MVCACLTAGFDAHEHLRIGGELAQEEEQALHGLRRAVAGEGAADDVDFLHHPSGEDELLTAGATTQDVDRGVDVHFRDAAVEYELHVSGAFELLEDELIHAAVGLDERRSKDGEGACGASVARSCEETARGLQCLGVNTAAHGATAAALCIVVGACEAGDGLP